MRLPGAQSWSTAALDQSLRDELAEWTGIGARLALGGLIVLSPFRARIELESRLAPPVYGDYTDILLFWSDLFLIGVLVLWCVSLALSARRVWLGPSPVRWPVVGLVAAAWLSVPLSVDPALSAYTVLRLSGCVALAVYAANELRGVAQIAPALAVMVVVQAIVAIGQGLGQASFGLPELGELRLNPNLSGISVVTGEDGTRLLRAYGLADHPNIVGGILAIALLLLLAGSAGLRRWRLVQGAVIALGAAALFLTFSRSAALSLAAGLGLALALLAWQRDRRTLEQWLGALAGAFLLCAALVQPYAEYLGVRSGLSQASAQVTTERRSLSERAALNQKANQVFVDNPLAGVGMGALPLALKDEYPDFAYHYQPAHVVLLDVAAETGMFGALFYAVLLLAPWALLWWQRRGLTPELIGVSGALLALSVIGFFDYYTWSRAPGMIWAWLVIGLWALAYRKAGTGDRA